MLYYLHRSTPFIILLVLTVALLANAMGATPEGAVNIPDTNLRVLLEIVLDKPDGAAITAADMATLTDFSAPRGRIHDLTGLEFAVNLIDLSLRENQFSDLSPLAGLTNLETLDLGGNPLADLSPLAGLTKLEFLDIPNCGISDLTPLAGLTHLIVP